MRLLLAWLAAVPLAAQQPQNPSPMVEHTRAHLRLHEQAPPGKRITLDLGTLFLPRGMKPRNGTPLLFFFHGGDWVPELAAARNRVAVVTVQAGAGSGSYTRLFADPERFLHLLEEAQSKSGMKFGRVMLGGWSAGCGAIRQILLTPESYARVDAVLAIDGIHTDYANGGPGPLDSKLATENLEVWLKLCRDAMAGRKRAILTHSEIFPGTYASTTETADYLINQLDLRIRPVLKWGPMGTQQLGEVRKGKLLVLGYAGNAAPDHVDQLHSLPVLLKALR